MCFTTCCGNQNKFIEIDFDGIKTVHIKDLPTISLEARQAINDFEPIQFDNRLKIKAEKLCNITQQLEDAEQHPVRDKIFMLLRSALAIGLIVGGIFGAIALSSTLPPVALVLGLVVILVAYHALCTYNLSSINNHNNLHADNLYVLGLSAPVIGPFTPLVEIFMKNYFLKEEKEKRQGDFDQSLKETTALYNRHSHLEQKLTEKIRSIQQGPSQDRYQKALDELLEFSKSYKHNFLEQN